MQNSPNLSFYQHEETIYKIIYYSIQFILTATKALHYNDNARTLPKRIYQQLMKTGYTMYYKELPFCGQWYPKHQGNCHMLGPLQNHGCNYWEVIWSQLPNIPAVCNASVRSNMPCSCGTLFAVCCTVGRAEILNHFQTYVIIIGF